MERLQTLSKKEWYPGEGEGEDRDYLPGLNTEIHYSGPLNLLSRLWRSDTMQWISRWIPPRSLLSAWFD